MPRFNSNHPIPLLFLGDSADSQTGLGRIGHDLAWLASSMPEFQVGYLGRGAFGSARFPWAQYSFTPAQQWGEQQLESAWNDLAGDRRGIIMTVWDASRLLWFADGKGTGLEPFLNSGRFERWGYYMMDAAGVRGDTLPMEQAHVVSQYQRAVFASKWAYNLASNIEGPDLDWIPHPINRTVFRPQGRAEIRSAWGIDDGKYLVGCVMTNQARKSWPVVMETVRHLRQRFDPTLRLWIHTDALMGYWNLPALAVEYGIEDAIIHEGKQLRDHELTMRYSACDATLLISGGEGFGYPVAESLSCDTPVVTGTWGAQAELTSWTVPPAWLAIDTSHNVLRAHYSATEVCQKLQDMLANPPEPGYCERLVTHLDGPLLGQVWRKWFKKGLL